jgi:hypothetical protein
MNQGLNGLNSQDLKNNMSNEPEYEILRTEGIECNGISESDSTTSLMYAGLQKTKRKKRHKHKRNKYKRSKNLDNSDEFNYDTEISEKNLQDSSSSSSTSSTSSSTSQLDNNFTMTKRVKLMFGNEMKILNIPKKIENTTSSDATNSFLKSNSKSILVTNVFN